LYLTSSLVHKNLTCICQDHELEPPPCVQQRARACTDILNITSWRTSNQIVGKNKTNSVLLFGKHQTTRLLPYICTYAYAARCQVWCLNHLTSVLPKGTCTHLQGHSELVCVCACACVCVFVRVCAFSPGPLLSSS